MTETVSLPEALLVSRFGTAGPAALTAFLRIQDPKGTVMTDLTAPVAGAASVTISMNRGSWGHRSACRAQNPGRATSDACHTSLPSSLPPFLCNPCIVVHYAQLAMHGDGRWLL